MKILKKGKGPEAFWVGKKLSCPACGCKFQLEKGDNVKFDRSGYLYISCPQCKYEVEVK